MNILQKRIGIIGGGQLGKMMILDAKRLGFYVAILDPVKNCPAHSISDKHIVADFDDEKAIRELSSYVDVITYEFEHIGIKALKKLESEGHIVYPTISSLEIIQDKFSQKTKLQDNNIPVPNFIKVNNVSEIKEIGNKFGYPMMLKACKGGYDGKGNAIIKDETSIEKSYELLGGDKTSLMIEEFVPFKMEVSVLACRGINGEVSVYPVGENIHKNSILDETIVPANISKNCTNKAMDLAHKVMDVFEGVGMFCVEMFVTEDEHIIINEVAPRPHNSGHYTIEGCLTSQFEQHIRAITGLGFGDVSLRTPIVMKNIIGEKGENGNTYVTGLEEVYKNPNVKVHLYGKEEVREGRKMGHLTVIGKTVEEALQQARLSHSKIKILGK